MAPSVPQAEGHNVELGEPVGCYEGCLFLVGGVYRDLPSMLIANQWKRNRIQSAHSRRHRLYVVAGTHLSFVMAFAVVRAKPIGVFLLHDDYRSCQWTT